MHCNFLFLSYFIISSIFFAPSSLKTLWDKFPHPPQLKNNPFLNFPPQFKETCVELIVDVTIIIQLLKNTMIEIYEKNYFKIMDPMIYFFDGRTLCQDINNNFFI